MGGSQQTKSLSESPVLDPGPNVPPTVRRRFRAADELHRGSRALISVEQKLSAPALFLSPQKSYSRGAIYSTHSVTNRKTLGRDRSSGRFPAVDERCNSSEGFTHGPFPLLCPRARGFAINGGLRRAKPLPALLKRQGVKGVGRKRLCSSRFSALIASFSSPAFSMFVESLNLPRDYCGKEGALRRRYQTESLQILNGPLQAIGFRVRFIYSVQLSLSSASRFSSRLTSCNKISKR